MYKYIEKMLTELQSDMNVVSTTQARLALFNINPQAKKLLEDMAQPCVRI